MQTRQNLISELFHNFTRRKSDKEKARKRERDRENHINVVIASSEKSDHVKMIKWTEEIWKFGIDKLPLIRSFDWCKYKHKHKNTRESLYNFKCKPKHCGFVFIDVSFTVPRLNSPQEKEKERKETQRLSLAAGCGESCKEREFFFCWNYSVFIEFFMHQWIQKKIKTSALQYIGNAAVVVFRCCCRYLRLNFTWSSSQQNIERQETQQ